MINIILVDTDDKYRKNLVKNINNIRDYNVIAETSSSIEALKLIEELKPDVIITDVSLPVIDGLQLIEKIKEKSMQICPIILSEINTYNFLRQALKIGVKDYLLKPINIEELIDVLSKIKVNIEDRRSELKSINRTPNMLSEIKNIDKEKNLSSILNKINNNINSLLENIKICNKEKVDSTFEETIKFLNETDISKEYFMKIIWYMTIKILTDELIFKNIFYECNFKELIYKVINIDSKSELVIYTNSLIKSLVGKTSNLENKKSKKTVDIAKKYINEHYKNNISLKLVADHVFLNANYFSKVFKEEVGKNFIDYLMETRILAAKNLLSKPGIKIYEVAEAVGYGEVSSFNRAFKKIIGITPQKYISFACK